MRRALLLSIAFALAALSGASIAAPPSKGVALATGAENPMTHDFGTDRYAPGQTPFFLADKAAAEAAVAKAHGKANLGEVRTAHLCLSQSEAMTLAGYDSALIAPDAQAWAEAKAAADAAYDRFTAARTAVLAGEPAPYPEFAPDASAITASAKATAPEAKALFQRKAMDGLWRHALVYAAPRAYAGDLGKAGAVWLNARLTLDGCAVDADNAAWLRGALAKVAWFDIKTYGKDADAAAWLLAEHADADPVLQATVLDRMGQLAINRQSNPANFAFLWDHVALNTGRPQRYGTQLRCVGKAMAPVPPVEDPAKLDERRGWVGLAPMAIVAQQGAKTCGG